MNNKGQTLVAFIILIPLLFMIMGLIIDVSYASYEKRKIVNNLKYTIRTSLEKNLNEEDIKSLLYKNIDNIEDSKIVYEDGVLSIYISTSVDGVFKNLFNNSIKEIKVTYKGYLKGESIVIERG